ncbi:MAG: hypothetical protein M3478_04705 [Planctomycetota bacterium]|nr:hypothetical protein [Planctomycetota bacterium]
MWNGEAHQLVAWIAEARLSKNAKAGVKELLGDADLSDAEVVSWADEIRRERSETAPWHYVSIPIDSDGYDPKRDGNDGNNDAGQVAFTASLDAGGESLYVGNGTTLTPLLDTSGPFEDLSWTAINTLGQVAFAGTLDGGTTGGVYMALGGGAVEKVIGIGDPLFGSTVTSVFMKTDALNDTGEIALIYRLATGVRGVAIATPVSEPHALTVTFGGLWLLACRRRSS